MRPAAVSVALIALAAGCGGSAVRVSHEAAIAQAHTDAVKGPAPPPGQTVFPTLAGTADCRVPLAPGRRARTVAGRCTTAAETFEGGAVVVTFRAAWPGGTHTWSYTVVPAGKGGVRGPAESGPAPWRKR